MKRCALFLLFRFAAGLFEGVELDGKALKEKPEKLAYLDKLLKYTEEVLGEQIPVRTVFRDAPALPRSSNVPVVTFCR